MTAKSPITETKEKWVYVFGPGRTEGGAALSELLGGKGANIAEMANLNLPVPPGFTIITQVCHAFFTRGRELPPSLRPQVADALSAVGEITGMGFGDTQNPLLVSVRSGARASMPGMMDTILNLGLNDLTVNGLSKRAKDERFAYDCYRRFIQMYADVVLGVDHGIFEDILENYKNLNAMSLDTELEADDWRVVIDEYKKAVVENTGEPFPQDTNEQLWRAISAVFGSWQNARARTYRSLYTIPDAWGTAVNIQAMVFGNLGDTSATGVAFTRNPSTGEKEIFGEYLRNAQGEDVVSGVRTPQPLLRSAGHAPGGSVNSLEALMPDTFEQLKGVLEELEKHYGDMQDVEFTIENGKLWMLQTRAGKRTTAAAIKIAADLAVEGIITREEAVSRIDPLALDQLLHPTIAPGATNKVITTGLPASPGAASGLMVFTPEDAVDMASGEVGVILVRKETSPEDIHGMQAAAGILTARGGMTSHAAVVARGMGRPCVTGAGAMRIDMDAKTMRVGSLVFKKGDTITIDGTTGRVFAGAASMRQPELTGSFGILMDWADSIRKLDVRANADTQHDARQARDFGAQGIGLSRTEHMFFDEERIVAMREMILAQDAQGRRQALQKTLPMQRSDFKSLFEVMAGLPVTIRLLDPPLHEFLPHEDRDIKAVARELGVETEKLKIRISELKEFNPMLGFRGCRLGIVYPEIVQMQARAMFEAAVEALKTTGQMVKLEVMVPLVAFRGEFDAVAGEIRKVAASVEAKMGQKIAYEIGTMVELPRAALRAREIAQGEEGAAFFSFGTNDLTQTCLGLSRDDAGPILETYLREGVLTQDPFVSLDEDGVGALIRLAIERGRQANPDLKLGICGEHGGDPRSIALCHAWGLDYVSCSPFRVPVARLAAAQAALKGRSS